MRTYPELPGLQFSVVWRAVWSGEVQTHESGAEFRMSYWSSPLWEWEFTYEFLRDGRLHNRDNWDELRRIVGLFNVSCGRTFGFRLRHPDDNSVKRQLVGRGDGIATDFVLVRTYGSNNLNVGFDSTESIGFIDLDKPSAVYLGTSGTPVVKSDPLVGYSFITTTPGEQFIRFLSPPAPGANVYVDMSYFYYARFREQEQDFEKFMRSLWTVRKVILRSLRPEAAQ